MALVHCHAAGATDRLEPPFDRETPLIKGMAGLVQHTHQGPRKIVFVVARRDPHIIGSTAAKWMGADVQPAVREVEADTFHQPHGEAALRCGREGARGGCRGQSHLAAQGGLDQIRQEIRDFIEQAIDLGDRSAWLVLVEQSLVRAGSEPLGFEGGDLAFDMEDSLQPRKHGGEVVLQTASAPDGFAFRAGARLGLDKRARHRCGVQPASAHLAQIGPLPLAELIACRVGFGQHGLDLRRD